ncbi:MAG: hypothetical protein EYC62_01030 [Alphaproteobacteria bacterium]|nr:MAG: hypothetical protein EYC62_01030 [Alphaproteobacteria bacterium]
MLMSCTHTALESRLQMLPGVMPLTHPSATEIFNNLKAAHWNPEKNSLNHSLAYFTFTGRKGAWLYYSEDTIVIFCWHPNIKNQLLVYPPIGRDFTAIYRLLDLLAPLFSDVRLARFSQEEATYFIANNQSESIFFMKVIEENILDWKFASPVLSTQKATEKTGPDLHLVRKEYRKLDLIQLETRPYVRIYYDRLAEVGHVYADLFLSQNKDFALGADQITQPNADMLNLVLERPDLYQSYVTLYKGRVEGFYVLEKFAPHYANALWFLYNRSIRGLAYWQMTQLCEMLKKENIHTVNLGGSETNGMDFFKTRFRPIQSFSACSIDVELMAQKAFIPKAA